MASFIVFERLSQIEAQAGYEGITKWFKENPRRRVCNCELFKVRRGHVKEDLLLRSVKGATIKE